MDKFKQRLNPLIKRVFLVLVIIVILILFMDFNSRISELFHMNVLRNEVHKEVYQLELTKQALTTQIAYATSEIAVEEWAREQGHMAQPGDIPIIPLQEPNTTPTLTFILTPTPPKVSNWQVWQALFFGE